MLEISSQQNDIVFFKLWIVFQAYLESLLFLRMQKKQLIEQLIKLLVVTKAATPKLRNRSQSVLDIGGENRVDAFLIKFYQNLFRVSDEDKDKDIEVTVL